MALIDDDVKHVIDSNKAKNYQNQTKKMFKKWLEQCPVKKVDVTSNEFDFDKRTICFSIAERK
jgi:hypothetical protein|tara:strand:- start:115 stop:303 length:189 start_codon:yes stop_codon:yes gene_type:complete